jgi:DNA-binding NtrC family response regulator
VAVNCAAIPDGLLESELFGYERGAFTGATGTYEGKLRLAHGGTLLLDEIGDMSAYAQAKMLRALESREAYRLGGRRPVPFDVRVVAATNEDLWRRVEEGRFRKDLYFRLDVARLHLPPLRERPEDVPDLLEHWCRELRRRTGHAPAGFRPDALDALRGWPWAGNVRELRNLVEVLAAHADGRLVAAADLEAHAPGARHAAAAPLEREPADAERDRLLQALHRTRWNKSRAAAQLSWSRMTLYRKMAKYSIGAASGGPAARVPAGGR